MFTSTQTEPVRKELLQGIMLTTLCWGESMLMARFDLKAGSEIPSHHHPHEQIGHLISGSLRLRVGADEFTALPGDSWCIAANTAHSAAAETDCVAIEVFSPPRQEYLPPGAGRAALRT